MQKKDVKEKKSERKRTQKKKDVKEKKDAKEKRPKRKKDAKEKRRPEWVHSLLWLKDSMQNLEAGSHYAGQKTK